MISSLACCNSFTRWRRKKTYGYDRRGTASQPYLLELSRSGEVVVAYVRQLEVARAEGREGSRTYSVWNEVPTFLLRDLIWLSPTFRMKTWCDEVSRVE